ncbi:MAG: D-alanyl-D-alanine carboxypeptidase/D-alanyl-D-alanine-endopeptidase [Verrucomicrobiota bacterium]
MVTLSKGLGVLGLVVLAATLQAAEGARSVTELQQRLAAHVGEARFNAALWGVKVESLDTGATLFEHNAERLLKPASNNKLYTGALALDRLGPGFRIRTSVYAAGKPGRSGVVKGDLLIYGRGDPSFAARFNNGDYGKSLAPLVEAIAAAGIKRVKGDLVGDESYFRGPPMGSGWTWDDLQYYYGAEVSALTLEDNTVDLVFQPGAVEGAACEVITRPKTDYLTFVNFSETVAKGGRRDITLQRPIGQNVVQVFGSLPVGSADLTDAVAVHDPALFFVTQLRAALAARGIRVEGQLRTVNWLERQVKPFDAARFSEVAHVESRPMAELVKQMMKPSQNLYAHLLLLQVAANVATNVPTRAWRTTEDDGIAVLRTFLGEAGIARGEVLVEEGSGLSRSALVTPQATVELLKFMAKHRYAGAFRESLPIAGVDGTLRARLKGTAAEKNVLAKTGTLRYVNALSGYVTSAAGERLVFSMMLNNYNPEGNRSGRAELDDVAVMLAEFAGRSAK